MSKAQQNTSPSRYRFLEALPGLLTWFILIVGLVLARANTPLFAGLVLLFMAYWLGTCISIVFSAHKGYRRIRDLRDVDWLGKLDEDFPDWKDYAYCTILPFASESINVLRPTIASLAAANFPGANKYLFLSPEAALPAGKAIAETLAAEFKDSFAGIYVTEHVLKPGELKGKASNQNHCGQYAYRVLGDLGLDPGHVLVSSNDSDMHIEAHYPAYLLHSYLSQGEERDCQIYQPIPSDLGDYWKASFFTRMLITSGILWRITLQLRGGRRCTVFSFYSMSLKTLHDIGFWDADVIPEDERTMFKAIEAFGPRFRVHPLFVMTRGTSIRGSDFLDSVAEQYSQIRRWAWGASEIAHSLSVYSGLGPEGRRAMVGPIANQIRTAVEWSLAPLVLVFGGFLPNLLNPLFRYSDFGFAYNQVMGAIALLSTALLLCTMALERHIAPPRPREARDSWRRLLGLAQWFLTPAVSLAFGALPALEAQTRLMVNQRIMYVESRKE